MQLSKWNCSYPGIEQLLNTPKGCDLQLQCSACFIGGRSGFHVYYYWKDLLQNHHKWWEICKNPSINSRFNDFSSNWINLKMGWPYYQPQRGSGFAKWPSPNQAASDCGSPPHCIWKVEMTHPPHPHHHHHHRHHHSHHPHQQQLCAKQKSTAID